MSTPFDKKQKQKRKGSEKTPDMTEDIFERNGTDSKRDDSITDMTVEPDLRGTASFER